MTTSPSSPFEPNRAHWPKDHPDVRCGRVGVLLLNLGTPDGTGYWPMRRYLKEFLSDERVIEEPRWKWWPILNLIILTVRPGKKGKDYATIWNKEKDEGPLKTITRSQAEQLCRAFEEPAERRRRLGHALRQSLDGKPHQGAEGTRLRPYSSAAALSPVCRGDDRNRGGPGIPRLDENALAAGGARRACPITTIPSISTPSRARCKRAWRNSISNRKKSSRHFTECRRNISAPAIPIIASARKRRGCCARNCKSPNDKWLTTFQSRFGNDPWLQPYTDMTVESLAKSGIKRLVLVAPGFSADCLETLEELDGENRHIFDGNGGEKFAYLPALNDSPEGSMSSRPSFAANCKVGPAEGEIGEK